MDAAREQKPRANVSCACGRWNLSDGFRIHETQWVNLVGELIHIRGRIAGMCLTVCSITQVRLCGLCAAQPYHIACDRHS